MDPIKVDPEIMGGTPCFAGTRVPIQNLFDYLEGRHPLAEFLDHFPSVRREQAVRVIEIAREAILAPLKPARAKAI
jgi:uncharacterized protein (DUF433 family)